ncbi:MAG: protein kinase, partial [Gemmatimonadales bacterium]|nr:protein kinase [Gemmatimonadales bacterium]
MATTLNCLKCGEIIRPADRFCSRCGDELVLSSGSIALPDSEAADDDPDSPWAEVVQRLRRATFGEFDIGRELGRGGMAAVFLAHELSLDREVAIKVMSPGLLMGAGMIDRFKREAITIAHLNHPNIVSCYSVRQAEGLHFFVMRYIRGRSLEQLIQDAGKLPLVIVRSILCQVGSALTYAHRSRVVHRDIKPANILIDEDGNAVVTDFGIAKVAELPGQTHTGALVGTPAYMSPEQCDGGEVSGASDQYSLGAVAYEMVTGVAPFTGSTLTVMHAQVEQAPRPLRDYRADCPPEFEAAILRMMAKDPADRFANMAEAKAAMGATPLMEDDPLLGELCRLAVAGTPPRTGTRTPVGPKPYSRESPAPRPSLAGQARSLVILPPPAELTVGDGFALVALVRGERGVPLPGKAVEWSTDAPHVLHIDRSRHVATAVAPG